MLSSARYHVAAIILHWVMAVAFLLMFVSGLTMVNLELEKALQFRMYQWHKSLGVLLQLAFFLRFAIYIFAHKPRWPHSMKPIERTLAVLGHRALYVWMLIVPLTGWFMVSSSIYGLPTIVFGWFEWPHVPGIAGNQLVEEVAEQAHQLLAYGFMALVVGHVLAVVKHAVVDKENLLPRMGIGKGRMS
ncbi:MAG: cytochrome b [Rickettsiales bacterium]|nr:cytochrome b [Rickettsiales bacterium]